MIVFFGTRGVSSKLGEGRFHCPRCGTETPYVRRRVRQFFHLYYIPLVPLGERVELVECGVCRTTFDPAILGGAPVAAGGTFDYEFHRGLLRAMVALLPPGAAEQEEAVGGVRDLYRAETGIDLSAQEVKAVVRQTEEDPGRVDGELSDLAQRLDGARREQILRAARAVASRTPGAGDRLASIEASLAAG